MKEETDRVGLCLRLSYIRLHACSPSQWTLNSVLVSIKVADQWETRPPDKRATGLGLGLSLPKRIC